jgi:hypothetical protein
VVFFSLTHNMFYFMLFAGSLLCFSSVRSGLSILHSSLVQGRAADTVGRSLWQRDEDRRTGQHSRLFDLSYLTFYAQIRVKA